MTTNTEGFSTIHRTDNSPCKHQRGQEKNKTQANNWSKRESTTFQNHMDLGSGFATYRLCKISNYVSKVNCLGAIGIQHSLGTIFNKETLEVPGEIENTRC